MVVAERSGPGLGPGPGQGGRNSSFRLSGRDSVSSASLYKQRIDSMFDEERSVISHHTYGVTQPPSVSSRSARNKAPSISGRLDGPGGLGQAGDGMRARSGSHGAGSLRRQDSFNSNPGITSVGRNSNSVQASIERMFSELAMETNATNTGTHTFTVDYLGSTPLPRRVTSLAGLQAPLSNLYLAYRRTKPIGTLKNNSELAARLEISRAGLHVRHCGPKGELEQLNPFPTIAVWSAVKFVLQPSEEDKSVIEYAFLPLITDPDNIDKQALFRHLELSEKKYILGRDGNSHSPLFTVVMRKIGVAKQLECHGFVCQTSEDAIVIAATLYKSLMAHMSRVPRAKGGITGPSIASSIAAPVRPPRRKRSTSIASNDSDRHSTRHDTLTKTKSLQKNRRTPDKAEPPPPPPPPPNKLSGIDQVKAKLAQIKNANETNSDRERGSNTPPKTIYNESMEFLNKQLKNSGKNSKESSLRSKVSEKIELFSILEKGKDIPRPVTVPPPVPIKPKKDSTLPKESHPKSEPAEPLRRSHSTRNSCEPGDILTKVAIPRSGSFLNASGLSRYKSTGQRNNGKKGGGSPLGFSELFNEFRVQEDLHSMDDILGAIIDAEGMSFNDLKPIYKEFLLKLAVTLTKDELFQHSKAIMRRQKKKLLRRNSTVQNKRKKMLIGAKGLKMVFRKPFGKDMLKNKILNIGEKNNISKTNTFEIPRLSTNKNKIIVTSESSVSTSSYDLRQFHPKEATPNQTPKRQSVKRRNSKRSETANLISKSSKRHGKGRNVERVSTSEDSDFLTLSRRIGCQNRNSSSGYVSCSECESESCADRCYCAARARPRPPPAPAPLEACKRGEKCCDCTAGESSQCYSCCGCDTESCADSDKCYCRTNPGARHGGTTLTGHHSRGGRHPPVTRTPNVTHHGGHSSTCKSGKCLPVRSHRSPRQRSVPGPATLDSLYYEPLKPKARSVLNHTSTGLEFMTKRNSRFDTFERMSCSTEVGRPSTGLTHGGRKSYSSDNLHLDYDIFMSTRGMGHYGSKGRSMQLPIMTHHRSKEALVSHKDAEVGALFSDGRLLSARRGLYRGPSAALADSLGYLP